MDHIILEGFVGCGKGAVGKRVAKELNIPLIEVDKLVSNKLKMTPADIYDRFGEIYYRALETVVLNDLKNRTERSVIILGSGLPLLAHNDIYLEELGSVYWLKMSKDRLFGKLKRGKKYDWMKDEESNLQIGDLLKEREAAYKRIAASVINVDGLTVEEAAQEVLNAVRKNEEKEKEAELKKSKEAEKAKDKEKAKEKDKAKAKVKAEEKEKDPVKEKGKTKTKDKEKEKAKKDAAPETKKKASPKKPEKPAAKETSSVEEEKKAPKKTTKSKAKAED